jgi:hypothetical protein
MPNLEEHCRHCLERFGVEGREIHKWIDEPSRYYGRAHREIRHDLETADYVAEEFGASCGEGAKGQYLAKLCYFDHIFLDVDASKQNAADALILTEDEIKEFELQKPIVEKEVVKIQKQIKQLDELPPLTIKGMKEYINIKLKRKSVESKQLAEVSLRHWQKYLMNKDPPNREINEVDINNFVAYLEDTGKSPYTRANYLGQLVAYSKYAYGNDITLLMQAEKNKADKEVAELKKNASPLRIKVVKRFYDKTKPHVKLPIRLLLLENKKVDDITKITAMQDSKTRNYHFYDKNKTEIEIDPETAKLAVTLLERNNDKLVRGGRRSLSGLFSDWSEKLQLEPNITPMDLRTFGKNHHPADIKEYIFEDKY